MNQKSGTSKDAADKLVKGIKRKTRKQYSAEEKIGCVSKVVEIIRRRAPSGMIGA